MIEAEYKAQLPQNSNEKPVDNKLNDLEKNDSTQKDSPGIKEKMNIKNDEMVTQLNGDNVTEEPSKKKKKKSKQSLDAGNNETETKLKENVEPQTAKKPKKNKNNDSIQELQEIEENNIIDSETIEKLNNNCKSEETPKKKKKSKKSLNAVNNETDIKTKDADLQPAKKMSLPEINYDTKDILDVKDKNSAEAQPSSLKKSKKNKIKSDIEVNNDTSHNVVSKTEDICIENGENGILYKKSELTMSKKEKKEMKKKIKYQQELETVSNGIIESDKEPILKKKKRKLINNEENEEPQQKIIKTGNFDVFILAYLKRTHMTCICCLCLI